MCVYYWYFIYTVYIYIYLFIYVHTAVIYIYIHVYTFIFGICYTCPYRDGIPPESLDLIRPRRASKPNIERRPRMGFFFGAGNGRLMLWFVTSVYTCEDLLYIYIYVWRYMFKCVYLYIHIYVYMRVFMYIHHTRIITYPRLYIYIVVFTAQLCTYVGLTFNRWKVYFSYDVPKLGRWLVRGFF